MSFNPIPELPDDPLARAEAAIRRIPVPEGPTDETKARTLAALGAAAGAPESFPFPRRRTMLSAIKIAAAALAAGIGLLCFTLGPSVETAAFAEAAQKLHDARTLTYRMTVQIPGQKGPMKLRYFISEPGLFRSDSEPPGGPSTIIDVPHERTLILNAATKSALLLEGKMVEAEQGHPRDPALAMVEGLRALAGMHGEPVGKKPIDAVEAHGFRVKQPGQELTVWVDPKSRLPVQVEVMTKFSDVDVHGTISNIELDRKLDDALFRTDPPEGYTLQKMPAQARFGKPEDVVIRLLRSYAEKSGGAFPTKLDDFEAYGKVLDGEKQTPGLPGPKMIQLVQDTVRLGLFLRQVEGRFGYNAEGVKLGDAGKILFWYQRKGTAKYRAVFGDLHATDVTAEQLPEKPVQ
jgi:outer membrane lipoprotein-sorting protein